MNSTHKKRIIANAIMVIAIISIFISGVMVVGNLKGWFDKESLLVANHMLGNITIERDGVVYTLPENASIREGDIIKVGLGSNLKLCMNQSGEIILDENTAIEVVKCNKDDVSIIVKEGQLIVNNVDSNYLNVVTNSNSYNIDNSIAIISTRASATDIYNFKGYISVSVLEQETIDLQEGKSTSLVEDENGKWTYTIEDINITSLNEFALNELLYLQDFYDFCIKKEAVNQEIDNRKNDIEKSISADADSMYSVENEDTTKVEDAKYGDKENSDGNELGGSNIKSDSTTTEGTTTDGASSNKDNNSSDDKKNNSTDDKNIDNTNYCTITIRCDTILNNMGNLTAGKDIYVPSNGVILATSTLSFEDGETVCDVLKSACSLAGIPLEYSWTPMYDSYYVEGINNLYEFDCGEQSGWIYKVNGWFPNYGCSTYTLKNGDVIVWCYTCNGLGADVGGSVN